jgi:hypothetical protein
MLRNLSLQGHPDAVRAEISEGFASLRAGEGVDGEAVFERIERELAAEPL